MKVALDFVKAEAEGKDAVMLDADGAVVDVEVPSGEKKKKKRKAEVRPLCILIRPIVLILALQAEGVEAPASEKKKSKKSKAVEVSSAVQLFQTHDNPVLILLTQEPAAAEPVVDQAALDKAEKKRLKKLAKVAAV